MLRRSCWAWLQQCYLQEQCFIYDLMHSECWYLAIGRLNLFKLSSRLVTVRMCPFQEVQLVGFPALLSPLSLALFCPRYGPATEAAARVCPVLGQIHPGETLVEESSRGQCISPLLLKHPNLLTQTTLDLNISSVYTSSLTIWILPSSFVLRFCVFCELFCSVV